MKSLIAAAIICLAGGAGLWLATDGLQVFTTESARRLAVLRNPAPLPDVRLQDEQQQTFGFSDYHRKLLLVDFIYTRCTTLCHRLSAGFQQLQTHFMSEGLSSQVRLLSISFDPTHDTHTQLHEYASRYQADAKIWRIARPADIRHTPSLLDAFGIIALDDGEDGFVHNAAIHAIDQNGRLVAIFDTDALAQVKQWVSQRI